MGTYQQQGRGMVYDKSKKRYDFEGDTVSGAPLPGQNEYAGPNPSAAGAGRGKPARSPAVEEAIQEMQDAKARKKISDMGYKKGGTVSASRRADGIAQRGKTRGKTV